MKSTWVVVSTSYEIELQMKKKNNEKSERRCECALRIQPILYTQKPKSHDAAPLQTQSHSHHTHNRKICWSVKILNARGIGKSFFFFFSFSTIMKFPTLGTLQLVMRFARVCLWCLPRADAVMVTISSIETISIRGVRCTCARSAISIPCPEMRLQFSLLLPEELVLRAWASAYRIAALNSVTFEVFI